MPLRLGIVGMGPSGLNAAFAFCEKCTLPFELYFFEKKEKPAKKLLATGNGRANLSHEGELLTHYHGTVSDKLIQEVFADFGFEKTKALHERLGILYTTDERGRIYPHSLNAKAVTDAYENELTRLCRKHSIHLLFNTVIKDIRPLDDGSYAIRAVGEGKGEYRLDAVILACGGEASPAFGSDGDGRYLLEKLGIAMAPTRPALCRLNTFHPIPADLTGLKWDVVLSVADRSFKGELLFTKEGLSGPAALESSYFVGEELTKGKASVEVNFCPDYTREALIQVLIKLLKADKAPSALQCFLPLPLVNYLYKSDMDTEALADAIQHSIFEIRELSGFTDAQVTVGGVLADELNPDLSLKKYARIYICGELLDIVGDCGGYNLQWAFSSGLKAGTYAAQIKLGEV